MKAVIFKELGVIEVQDVPEPEPAPDQIKVKIAYAGICGSDPIIVIGGLEEFPHQEGSIGWLQKPGPSRPGPKIMGHEASGTIVKIGKDVRSDFKVGQRVAMDLRNPCGKCYFCLNGMQNFCEHFSNHPGAMTEYGCYQTEALFPLPDDVSLETGAFLEPASIAVHAVDNAQMKIGDTVLITGGGSIGLLIMEIALRNGASKVMVSDPIAEKRKLAVQLGADAVVDPLKENLLEVSKKFTGGHGFNVSFETTGILALARQLILLAECNGTVVWVATYQGNRDVGVPITYTHTKEITIRNVAPSPYADYKALNMLAKLDLKPLTTVFPITDALKAFEAHKAGKDVKIMLKP
jgi:(R,R)-butanediol dehydrogenase/meso-butanediol dehydrogenase/diacetyl reductase/L-iditol 2-dehydrogenase